MVIDRANVNALPELEARAFAHAFAAIAGAAASAAYQDATVRNQLRLLGRRLRLERGTSAVEEELLDVDPTTISPAEIGRLLATRLRLPCTVLAGAGAGAPVAFGATGQPAAPSPLLAPDTRRQPEIAAALAGVARTQPRILGPYPHLGVRIRHVIARVPDGPLDALIVVDGTGRALRREDLRLVQLAAVVLATSLRVQRRLADADRRTGESVVRDAVEATTRPPPCAARAADVGLDLDALSVVCLLRAACGSLDADELRRAAALVGSPAAAHVASTPEGVVMIVALDASTPRRAAIAAVRAELEQLLGVLRDDERDVVAVVSSACRTARDLPHALDECRELGAGLGVVDPDETIRCADDLGVGKLLLGRISPALAERFLEQTFGSIADREERAKLLDTLDAYFAANRSVRATAARLGIHENTVRHRFRRLANATGLDVLRSTDDQLTARLALTMRRFPSNVPVPKERA